MENDNIDNEEKEDDIDDDKSSICPDCGAKLISKWSGVKCSECDYWFCY